MRTIALILLFFSKAYAGEIFSVEAPLENPSAVPTSIIAKIGSTIDFEKNVCAENNIGEALETTSIRLGPQHWGWLVKPKAWCLCGTYYCPVWIFEHHGNASKLIWSTTGTSGVALLDRMANGRRNIRELGTNDKIFKEWIWDGNAYRVVNQQAQPTPLTSPTP